MKQPPKIDNPEADYIINTVCEYFNITERLIKQKCREKQIVYPRFIAMYLLRNDLRLEFLIIGRILGNKDHTSVMHACKSIENFISIKDEQTITTLSEIRAIMKKDPVNRENRSITYWRTRCEIAEKYIADMSNPADWQWDTIIKELK